METNNASSTETATYERDNGRKCKTILTLEDQSREEIGVGGARKRREDTSFGARGLNAPDISRRPNSKTPRSLRPSNLLFFRHHPPISPPCLENTPLAPVESQITLLPSRSSLLRARGGAFYGASRAKQASEPSRRESFAGR